MDITQDFRPVRFASDDLPARDRVPAWREVYGPRVNGADVQPAPGAPFRADVTLRALPGFGLTTTESSPARYARTRRFLADGREWNEAMGREAVDRLDPAYLPALDGDAVRRVLRSRRSAVAVAPVQAIAETCSRYPAAGGVSDAAPTATCSGEIRTAEVSRHGWIERARAPAPATLLASDRRAAFARCAEHGAPTRLVVNGSGWSAPEWGVPTWPTPWQPARVIVLGARQGDQTTPAEASAGSDIGSSAEPPSCRGPPSRRRSSHAKAVTAAKLLIDPPGAPALSGGDPVVRDDLGEPIPVTAAEVDVIETYLGPLLDEILGSRPGSESQQA